MATRNGIIVWNGDKSQRVAVRLLMNAGWTPGGMMHQTKGYKSLLVWEKSVDLMVDVYEISKILPREERFGMTDQMRRAVVSIASNIAEGQGRNGTAEFIHFLGISQGSLCELDTLITMATRVRYIPTETSSALETKIREIRVMIYALANSLRGK